MGDAHGFSWTVVQSPGDLAILEHGVGDGVFSVGDTDNDTLGARHRVRAALLVLCYNLKCWSGKVVGKERRDGKGRGRNKVLQRICRCST